MKFVNFTFALAAALTVRAQANDTGALGDAIVVSTNPEGVTYTATLPIKQAFKPEEGRGSVKGDISTTAGPNGRGVIYNITISNLPTSGGPFRKHYFPAIRLNVLTYFQFTISTLILSQKMVTAPRP